MNTADQTQLQALFQRRCRQRQPLWRKLLPVAAVAAVVEVAAAAAVGGGGTRPTFNNLLDFALQCQNNGWMSEADFDKIYNDIQTTNTTYFYGRVNVNTAGADVLTALFMGLDPDTISQQTASGAAQTLITYRQQNPGNLNTLWWLINALGNNNPVITALASSTANNGGGWVTTKSFQFTADVAAVGPFGRGYRRVKFVFDTSTGTPIIVYRQDLSRLGWALGDEVRQTLLARNTTQ